ncbi:MAG: hypothetical protein PUF10_02650 [Bacteroidales bacterium]|nr:hypothetical protein [Bacteroidales bacterium]
MTQEEQMKFNELQHKCESMQRIIDEQASAIMKFTETIKEISGTREKCDMTFGEETYTSYAKFEGGVVLFR